MDTFHTSYCRPLDLAIEAGGQGLTFCNLPQGRSFDRFLVRLVGGNSRQVASWDFSRSGDKFLPTGGLPNGEYTLDVFSSTQTPGRFRGYIQNGEVPLRIVGGRPYFCEPWPLRENISTIRHIGGAARAEPSLLSEDKPYPCRHSEIRRIASVITAGISDDYGKILAVHDWVAENVFYDEDSLRIVDGTRAATVRSTMEVLQTRRAVCLGYSDLAVTLLRASGIPSVTILCFALGQGTRGGWERQENRSPVPNHAFTAALLRGRFVMMDITWDSDNVYRDRRYARKTGDGRSRKFFDMSPMLMSASHRLTARQWPNEYGD